jgi:predicted metal-dependent peptidase
MTKLTRTTSITPTKDFTSAILKTGTLAERLALRANQRKTVILCDTSGSMAANDVNVGSTTHTRIEQLIKVLEDFQGHEVRQFNSSVSPGPITRHDASGGTDMALAFNAMRNEGFDHIILLTDGEPNDANASLEAAKGLRIDTLYIGPGEPTDFLRQLTTATGGSFNAADLAQPAQIASAIKGLLEPQGGSK